MGVEVGEGGRRFHLRGVHYMLIGQVKPGGSVYRNTEREWKWLCDRVSKAARWLGYIPFTQVTDQRNAEPVIRIRPAAAEAQIIIGYSGEELVPDAEDFAPRAHLEGAAGIQPYRLAIISEKSSLEPVLGPVAEEFGADLYLPAGEISDTILHQMASLSAAEGRPLIVFYFADCDPSGWQMGISVSRKLQALSELLGPFEFEVHRVALVPGQVRELGLPSTPLKDTEKRAGKWEECTGTRQTEIDALAALRSDDLVSIARQALSPFFDESLQDRIGEAVQDWLASAQEIVDDGIDGDLGQLLADAEDKLGQARTLIDEVGESLQTTAEPGDLPEFEPPEPDVPIGDAFALRHWHDPGQQRLGLPRAVPGLEKIQGVWRGRGRGRGRGVMSAGGKQGGRSKSWVSDQRRATIWRMHRRGIGLRQIARSLGLHPSTVAYYLRDPKTPTRRCIVGPPKEQTDNRPTPQEHSAQVLASMPGARGRHERREPRARHRAR